MIIASHDLDFLTAISDRILVLNTGCIVCDMNPKDRTDSVEYLKKFYEI
jgi:polar amino acid transport system ATP-binding protein